MRRIEVLLSRAEFHIDLLQHRNEVVGFRCSKVGEEEIRQDEETKIFVTHKLKRRKTWTRSDGRWNHLLGIEGPN